MGHSLSSERATGTRIGRQNGASRPVMERVEPRRLMTATVTSWSDGLVSSLSGNYFGCVQAGDNGYTYGYPTVVAGADSNATAYNYNTWDNDLSDGFDSGYVPFQMGINVGGQGGGTITVGDADNATVTDFAADSAGSISQVTLQATVEGGSMMMAWQDVTVEFYSGGQLVESVPVGSFSADTLDSTGYDPAETIMSISANASNYDGVCITGHVRLVTAAGTYPNPTDIFGQVAIS